MPDTIVKEKAIFLRWISNAEIRFEKRGEQEVMTFPASSEYPVERWYGTEVLSHAKDAVRMGRANGGAMPLLFNHNSDDPRGMIAGARIEDGRLMVDATIFNNDKGRDLRAMIEGGLRNVSLGYQINVVEENTKNDTYTVTDWEPVEVSIVSVPADPTVGIGRTVSEYAVRMILHSDKVPSREQKGAGVVPVPVTARSIVMADETAAEKEAREKREAQALTAVEAEKQRCTAIRNLCKSNRIDSRVEDGWIFSGAPLTLVAEEMLKVMEERGKQKPAVASELGLSRGDAKKYSLFRAIRALHSNNDREANEAAAFEFECSRAVAKQIGREGGKSLFVPAEVLTRPLGKEAIERTMTTIPGSKGGYMVDVENLGFIDILRNRSVAMAMGARVLSGLQGNVMFPRQTGKVTVTWQAGEGASVTAADQALGQLSMTPRTCIAITDISEQLLRQASPSAESFVMADLAADVAIDGVDAAVINGTGGAQPLGIKNTTGITSGQDASSATYTKILQFPITAGSANAIRGNPGFVTNTAGAGKLVTVQRFTSTDTPIWVGNLMNGQLVGFNAMSSEQLASGNLIFGSWDEVVIGEWGVLELKTDGGGTRFNAGLIGIRAMWMVDVLVRYPQAFIVGTNLS